ncbi:MAG: GIY-YIG nuclease family protein [Saprospiraceae bacterium]|jgi:hypothetical protein
MPDQINTLEMPPFYVYCLINPEDNSIFYVGKGKGERGYSHVLESKFEKNQGPKHLKIREIENRGFEPFCRVIARFDTAQEAYIAESIIIKWMYGLDNLTNLVSGHNHINIRNNGFLNEVPGLDIPKRISKASLEYTNDIINKNLKLDIEGKLKSIVALIIGNVKFIGQISYSMKRPENPSIYIHNENYIIQIILRRNKNDNAVFNIKPNKNNLEHFQLLANYYNEGIVCGSISDRYFKIPFIKDKVTINEPEQFINEVQLLVDSCENIS